MSKVPYLKRIANPAMIEHLIRGYTAGLGKVTLEGIDAIVHQFGIIDMPTKTPLTPADIPGLRGFVQRFPIMSSRSVERLYRQYNSELSDWESKLQRSNLRGRGLKLEKPASLSALEKAVRTMAVYRKMIYILNDSKLEGKKKKADTDALTYMMINVARVSIGKEPIERPK